MRQLEDVFRLDRKVGQYLLLPWLPAQLYICVEKNVTLGSIWEKDNHSG